MRVSTAREREYLRDLVVVLTQKEIKLRYKNSWLGYIWSVANPLAFGFLYFIAFRIFMRVDIPQYPVFLLAGLFPWQWIANSTNAAPGLFIANATLLKKVRFPHSVLVVSVVLNDGVHFLCAIPVLVVFLLYYGLWPSWSWLIGIPVLAALQLLLVYGLSVTIASLNLFFRDLERLTSLVITFLFFWTPIIYPESMVPPEYQAFIYLNPAAPIVLSWRQLFLSGDLNWPNIALGSLYAILVFAMGTAVYGKLSWKFAEVI